MVLNYTYELPFFRKPSNLIEALLGGWQMNGITALQSGRPYSVGLTGPAIGLANHERRAGETARAT